MRVILFGPKAAIAPLAGALRARGYEAFARIEPSLPLVRAVRPEAVILAGEGPAFDAFAFALRRLPAPPRLIRAGAAEASPLFALA